MFGSAKDFGPVVDKLIKVLSRKICAFRCTDLLDSKDKVARAMTGMILQPLSSQAQKH